MKRGFHEIARIKNLIPGVVLVVVVVIVVGASLVVLVTVVVPAVVVVTVVVSSSKQAKILMLSKTKVRASSAGAIGTIFTEAA